MLTLMYENEKEGTNKPICKAAKETQAKRTDLQTTTEWRQERLR